MLTDIPARQYLSIRKNGNMNLGGSAINVTDWTNLTSNIPVDVSTGIVTLTANRVYQLTFGVGIAGGNNSSDQIGIQIVNATTDALLMPAEPAAHVYNENLPGGTILGSNGSASFIYRPLTNENVRVRATIVCCGSVVMDAEQTYFTITTVD